MREAQNDYHRMAGPDCTVMCNLINTRTHTPTRSNPCMYACSTIFGRSVSDIEMFGCLHPSRGYFLSISG